MTKFYILISLISIAFKIIILNLYYSELKIIINQIKKSKFECSDNSSMQILYPPPIRIRDDNWQTPNAMVSLGE